MSGHDDFDRTLARWFETDAVSPAPAGGLERALDATLRRRPRPAWLADLGSHWVREVSGSSSGVRSLPGVGLRWSTALILLLALVALVGGAIVVGAGLLQSSPLPTGRLGGLSYGLDGDIFVANWDGTNPRVIADGDPGAQCGDFRANGGLVSPDGRHIAYRSNWGNGCQGAVTVSDPDGTVISTFPGDGWNIAWSPDGTRIATWVGPEQTIGVYGIDGVRQALLDGSRMCCGDYDPVWSPDGAAAILVKGEGWGGTMWELPVDGGTPRRVPPDDPRSNMGFGWGPVAYSPDGTRAAFIVYQYQEPNGRAAQIGVQLIVAAAYGTQRQVLFEVDPGQGLGKPILWSPAGDQITFVVTRDLTFDADGYPTLQQSDLRLVDRRTGTATTLATARGRPPLSLLGFSPEGDRILFGQTDEDGRGSLRNVNTDGSGARHLVDGTDVGGWLTLPVDADAPSAP